MNRIAMQPMVTGMAFGFHQESPGRGLWGQILKYKKLIIQDPKVDRLFGTKAPLGSIYSFEMVGAGTGMALGGWVGGSLFDISGAYDWSLAASLVAGFIGLPLALSLPRHKKTVPVPIETAAPAPDAPSPLLGGNAPGLKK